MTRDAYGQYLRGYATAAFKPLLLPQSIVTSVIDAQDDDFVVRLSARCRGGSSYGPCPILIPIKAVEDNLAEECIDGAIAAFKAAFPSPETVPPAAARDHPVATAIAAMRTGAPHIGGDRH